MLLGRLAAECRTDNSLSERVIPVRLMEENYEISALADFWLEALIHLAHEPAETHPETSLEHKASHLERKSRWQEREIADRARGFQSLSGRMARPVQYVSELFAALNYLRFEIAYPTRNSLQRRSM